MPLRKESGRGKRTWKEREHISSFSFSQYEFLYVVEVKLYSDYDKYYGHTYSVTYPLHLYNSVPYNIYMMLWMKIACNLNI